MKYNSNEKHSNPDHALLTAMTSAFRSINPSYSKTYTWYTQKNHLKSKVSPLSPRKSRYYIPLFGSVFASALAFVMILTSSNNQISNEIVAFDTQNLAKTAENQDVASFSTMSTRTIPEKTEQKQVLAKIDAQSKASSRTQADESFTESLDTETSLQDLFE